MSPDVVKRKISQIDTYLTELIEISRECGEELRDRDRYAAERMMLLLIETASDLLAHTLKDKFKVKTRSYYEVFAEAAKKSLIDEKLKNILADLSGFRNMLVHQYVDINPETVFDNIDVFIGAFSEFMRQVKEWA